jgi:hypothetical protein
MKPPKLSISDNVIGKTHELLGAFMRLMMMQILHLIVVIRVFLVAYYLY